MTYERGKELNCPDCLTDVEHCCPFLWADQLLEPKRTQVLRHLKKVLFDAIEEVSAPSGI